MRTISDAGLYEFAHSFSASVLRTALIHRHERSPFPKGKVGAAFSGYTFNQAI